MWPGLADRTLSPIPWPFLLLWIATFLLYDLCALEKPSDQSALPFKIILGLLRIAISAITFLSEIHMNRNQAGYLKTLRTALGSTMTCKWRWCTDTMSGRIMGPTRCRRPRWYPQWIEEWRTFGQCFLRRNFLISSNFLTTETLARFSVWDLKKLARN